MWHAILSGRFSIVEMSFGNHKQPAQELITGSMNIDIMFIDDLITFWDLVNTIITYFDDNLMVPY